ncbi:hypothetical protein MKZ07_16640 [Paenibacillus sp. FSL P4-0338]|uniref:hypothetical protein n=1 Tax=unclassified Paenibacillus TaxID=185978 RepID=UPI0003E205ED|nr:hypothetical protein [Paenibacillus sp. FSL R7-269]ETT31694.1 hypothetical protein C162_32336 [Paenibacillus sp. FSL R7-269]
MLVIENQLPNVSSDVKQHIMGIIEASPTSQFHCHVTTEIPNVYVYLIEDNPLECYSIFHAFSYDNIDPDYSYQCFTIDQIHKMHQFIEKAKFI